MAEEIRMSALEQAKTKYDAALKAANEALAKTPVDTNGYNTALTELNAAEKDYAAAAQLAMFADFKDRENPVIEIIRAYSFKTIGHKETRNKDTNSVISVDATEKYRQVDLLAFCKYAKLETSWANTASRFNQLMCLRAATQLGISPAEVKKIATSYYMQDAVKKIEMGKTPTSNTQVCKLLQRVIDEMIPNETEDGKAIYKCNNHDVAYLDDLYGKKSNKQILTVRVSNHSFLRRIIVDIAYRLITNGKYGVDGYRVKKETK